MNIYQRRLYKYVTKLNTSYRRMQEIVKHANWVKTETEIREKPVRSSHLIVEFQNNFKIKKRRHRKVSHKEMITRERSLVSRLVGWDFKYKEILTEKKFALMYERDQDDFKFDVMKVHPVYSRVTKFVLSDTGQRKVIREYVVRSMWRLDRYIEYVYKQSVFLISQQEKLSGSNAKIFDYSE